MLVCLVSNALLAPLPAATFFSFITPSSPAIADLEWTLICFVVVLPLVGFTFFAYARRNRCLDDLAQGMLCGGV